MQSKYLFVNPGGLTTYNDLGPCVLPHVSTLGNTKSPMNRIDRLMHTGDR